MPVGVIPSTPVTVAPSESELPNTMVPLVGAVLSPGWRGVTVKHSLDVDPSEPPW